MVTAICVAKYILNERTRRGHSTTTFALQKLLYLCKAWCLVSIDDNLFEDAVSAWEHGPVVDSTWPYCRSKRYISSKDLPSTNGEEKSLKEPQTMVISRVLDMFENEQDANLGNKLERMSHEQDPWKNAVLTDDQIISDDSIKDYFEFLQAEFPDDQRQYIPYLADLSHHTIILDEDMRWLEKTFNLV